MIKCYPNKTIYIYIYIKNITSIITYISHKLNSLEFLINQRLIGERAFSAVFDRIKKLFPSHIHRLAIFSDVLILLWKEVKRLNFFQCLFIGTLHSPRTYFIIIWVAATNKKTISFTYSAIIQYNIICSEILNVYDTYCSFLCILHHHRRPNKPRSGISLSSFTVHHPDLY